MAFKVAEGFVELQPKINKEEFQRKVKETVRGSKKPAEDESKKTGSGAGLAFGAGFAGALSADVVKSALGGIIGGASDLNETMSKSNVVFGKSADSIHSWAANADTSMGMSQQAAEANANSLGLLFTQIGLTGGQAANMSKQWVQLAADLGSFNNADPTLILEAMTAATRGEYDSLQAYVPMVNAAAVEQKAMAMTGAANAKQLNEQDKMLAINQLMLEQTGAAQGDFARTSDGLANRTKIATAQLQNFAAGIGTSLLPVAADSIGLLTEMGQTIADIPTPVKIAGGALLGLGAVLGAAGPAWDHLSEKVTEFKKNWSTMSTFQRVSASAVTGVGIAMTIGLGILTAYALKQQEAKDRIQEFTSVLREQKGAVNAVTREKALAADADGKASVAARTLGIDMQAMVDAYIKGTDAQKFFNQEQINYHELAKKTDMSVEDTIAFLADIEKYLNDGVAANKQFRKEQGTLNQVLGEGEIKSRNLADAKAKQAEKEAAAAQKAKEEADALQELINKMTTLGRLTLTESEAHLSFEDAIDKATQSLKDNGKTLDENNEKGRANQGALNEIVDSTLRWVESGARAGASQAVLNARMNEGALAYAEAARKLGVSESAIDTYTKKVFGVPASKLTKLTADKKDADNKIKRLQADLKRTHDKKTIAKINADIREAQRKRKQIQAEIAGLKDRNILINIYRKTHYSETYSAQSGDRRGQGGRQSPGKERAAGGPVYAGMLYTVNEVGDEAFVPAVDGTIIPHHRLANPVYANPMSAAAPAGGGGVVYTGDINVTIPVRDVMEFKQVTDLLANITQQARTKPFQNRRQTGRG